MEKLLIVDVKMLIEDLKEYRGETIADICSDALTQQEEEISAMRGIIKNFLIETCQFDSQKSIDGTDWDNEVKLLVQETIDESV